MTKAEQEQLDRLDKIISASKENNFDMIRQGLRALNDRIDITSQRITSVNDYVMNHEVRVDKTYHRLGELIEKITSYEVRLLTMEKLLKIHNHYGEEMND